MNENPEMPGNPKSRLVQALEATLPRGPLRVLDAGCGSCTQVDFGPEAYVVGLDASEAALTRNERVDEAIVGDVQSFRLPPSSFDVALCWNVLEHLPHPERALANLARSLRPDGLLVLGLPNLLTPKALATKFTPYRFHVWIYRDVLGNRLAGSNGYPPFRTHLRLALIPSRLRRLAADHDLHVEYEDFYASDMVEAIVSRRRVLRWSWSIAAAAFRAAGRDPTATDIALILRRGSREDRSARADSARAQGAA